VPQWSFTNLNHIHAEKALFCLRNKIRDEPCG